MIAAASPRVEAPRVGECLRRAVRDFYEESWRLVTLNALFTGYVLVVLSVAVYVPAALVLLVGAGPLAAAVVYAAVTIVDEGSLTYRETFAGLRRCWRRGLVLGAAVLAAVVVSGFALQFYSGSGPLAWPLAVLVLYLAGASASISCCSGRSPSRTQSGRSARRSATPAWRSSAGPSPRPVSGSRCCS